MKYNNPIQLLKLSVPEFVWDWYEEKFKDAVKNHTNSMINSTYSSFTQTLKKYADGVYSTKKMAVLNIYFRRITENVYPILSPDNFFIGDDEQQQNEAIDTARRMITAYENEYKAQKTEAHVA